MCDDDHDFALICNGAKPFHQIPRDHTVQTGIRFIKNEEEGIGYVFHSDRQSFPLSAGEFFHQASLDGGESELLEDRVYAVSQLFAGGALRKTQESSIHQRPIHGVIASHQVDLRNKADRVFHLVILIIDIHAVQKDLCVGLFVTCHRIDEGGLAGTGSAQQQDHVPRFDIHEDLPQQITFVQKIADSAVLYLHGKPVVRIGHTVGDGLIEIRREDGIISVIP